MTSTIAPSPDAAPADVRPARQRGSKGIATTIFVILALVFPWLGASDSWMNIGVFALISAIGALGMQVIMGFTGQISMGHAAFMPIGAYTAVWLGVDHGQPFWIFLPAAVLVSAVAGAAFAPIAVRIRGLSLAVATLGLVFIINYVWETWAKLTGGVNGRTAATVEIGGQDLLNGYWSGDTEVLNYLQAWWYFALAILLVAIVLTWNLKRSRMGRAMMAVRDRDLAAGIAGIPVTSTKLIAFAISSGLAGLAGALLASFMGYISATQWTLALSIDFIAMVTIGGLGTISGALLGAFFVKAMPEIVRILTGAIPFVSADAKVEGGITVPLLSQFLYGFVIVLVLLFEPKGLTAMFKRLGALIVRTFKKGASA